ncbi:MAG: TMEM175 family protein [bacterium]
MSAQAPSDTARLETFADGVFAIAITLLILEIRLPASEAHREIGLFRILASLWPSYLGSIRSVSSLPASYG